jgi:hypothetical protein
MFPERVCNLFCPNMNLRIYYMRLMEREAIRALTER